MQVEIDEVVSTIRVSDRGGALDARELQRLVKAVLAAVDDKLARDRRQSETTAIADDGRGGITRFGDGGGL
jgi:hypothetical protein